MEETHSVFQRADKLAPGLAQAYQIAREKLSNAGDIREICRKSGTKCPEGGIPAQITVDYLNRTYAVSINDAKIFPLNDGPALSIKEKLLVFHYLVTSNGKPDCGKLITFQELPEGHIYYPTFLKRSIQPLMSRYGKDPGLLTSTIIKIFGGRKIELGDAAASMKAFPRVTVTFALWRGDEEFEARGSILFDAAISNYLPTEDITILCETISWKLIKANPVA